MQTGTNEFGIEHDDYAPLIEEHKDESRLFYVAPLLHPKAMILARMVEREMFPPSDVVANRLYNLYILNWPDRKVFGDKKRRQLSVFSIPVQARSDVDMLAKSLGIEYKAATLIFDAPVSLLFELLEAGLNAAHPALFPKGILVDQPLTKRLAQSTALTTSFPIRGDRVLLLATGQRQEVRACSSS